MRFKFTVKRIEVLRAALTELDQRLSRGIANSDLQDDTLRILNTQRCRTPGFHESDVGDILRALDQINLPADE